VGEIIIIRSDIVGGDSGLSVLVVLTDRLTTSLRRSPPSSAVRSALYYINSARKSRRHYSHFSHCSLTFRFVYLSVTLM